MHISVEIPDFLYVRWTKKLIFVGAIGYGDSYLEFFLVILKLFRLHAILLDAAGAHSGKRPGYFHKIRGGPNSCLPSHVTTTPPPLRKTFAAFHFQLCRLLNQYVLYCTRY